MLSIIFTYIFSKKKIFLNLTTKFDTNKMYVESSSDDFFIERRIN